VNAEKPLHGPTTDVLQQSSRHHHQAVWIVNVFLNLGGVTHS